MPTALFSGGGGGDGDDVVEARPPSDYETTFASGTFARETRNATALSSSVKVSIHSLALWSFAPLKALSNGAPFRPLRYFPAKFRPLECRVFGFGSATRAWKASVARSRVFPVCEAVKRTNTYYEFCKQSLAAAAAADAAAVVVDS